MDDWKEICKWLKAYKRKCVNKEKPHSKAEVNQLPVSSQRLPPKTFAVLAKILTRLAVEPLSGREFMNRKDRQL